MRIDIKAISIGVIEEYGTNDPFKLVDLMDIPLLFHELPETIDAYRLNNIIVINKNLDYVKQKWVLAHEIGHYILHDNCDTYGRYASNSLLIKEKIENEANFFASELLLSDIDCYVIEGLTDEQIASLYSVPKKFVRYKLQGR